MPAQQDVGAAHFITTTTMPPPWLLLLLLSLLPYTSASVPLSALRTRAELGAVDSPLAAHRAFTELVQRERRVISIYQDRAVRCHASDSVAAATHWATTGLHASHAGLIEEVGGVMACESVLREREDQASAYNADDDVEYREWLMYEVIPFMMERRAYFWLSGLSASLLNDSESSQMYADGFHAGPGFVARTPDEMQVCVDV